MIRLKDLKEKFKVVGPYEKTALGTKYNLYDINPNSGKSQVHRYLDTIFIDTKKGVVYQDGSSYKDIDVLYKDIYEYADSLEFCSDYYDPSYRVGIKEQMCIRDYMVSLGFDTVPSRSYSSYSFVLRCHDVFFGQKTLDITIDFDEDKTSGTITVNSTRVNDYRWVTEKFDNLEDAIGKINSTVTSFLLCGVSSTLSTLKKVSDRRAKLTGSFNVLDTDKFDTYTVESKEYVIAKLQEALTNLSE